MTKKYGGVYPPLIDRFLTEEQKKGRDLKAVKTKLHQVYGAYTQDNAHKKAAALVENPSVETANALLSLHASTKERLSHYMEFYDFIFRHTGDVESVLDVGCGYNPFSVPLMPNTKLAAYYAYDIDTRVAELINSYFAGLGLPQGAGCADLAVYTPQETADLGLMLKLMPVLEAQVPGSGFFLAKNLNVRYLVITYPTKSLGGRQKGMASNYDTAFQTAYGEGKLGKFTLMSQTIIGNELIYIMEAL